MKNNTSEERLKHQNNELNSPKAKTSEIKWSNIFELEMEMVE